MTRSVRGLGGVPGGALLAGLVFAVAGCGDNLPAQRPGTDGQSGQAGQVGSAGAGGNAGLGVGGDDGGLSGAGGVAGAAGQAGDGGVAGAAGDGGVAGAGGDGGIAGAGGGGAGGGGAGGTAGMGGAAGIDAGGGPDAGGAGGGGTGGGVADGGGGGGASGAGGAAGEPSGNNCDGTDCLLPGGGRGFCTGDNVCVPCTEDARCKDVYGSQFLCIGGSCVSGDCRTTADCTGGELCDVATNTCGACADDAACRGAFGSDQVCVNGACVSGNCHSAADCTPGQVCGSDHACQPCADDASCGPDYGGNHLCLGGACVPGQCRMALDCPAGEICDANTNFCAPCASDNVCQSGYGPGHLCVGGSCITGDCRTAANCSGGRVCISNACTGCTGDPMCRDQYGVSHLCIAGGCAPGECRSASDCAPGQLCGPSFTCISCLNDNECVSGYGANHLCVGGGCIAGDCRSTADCGGGRICNTPAFTCVACASDASCVADYGADHLCVGGNCIPGTCRAASDCAAGQLCDANTFTCTTCASDAACVLGDGPEHLCISGACVPGQCRSSPECAGGLCDTTTHLCGTCGNDAECVAAYGMNHLCVGGACISGTCHTTAECGGGQICNPSTFTCEACGSDAACVTAYGAGHLCEANVCIVGQCRTSAACTGGRLCDTPTHACVDCQNDSGCQGDASYGTSTFCLQGACTAGDCRDTGDCPTGQLCGSSTANTCGGCTRDAQCLADATYGAGHICFQGICQQGDCHGTSGDCQGPSAGLVCGAVAANRCGACSSDQQCQEDPMYGSSTICNTAAAQPTSGQCVSAACNVSGACPSNGGDFCCDSLCVPGNCCSDADCSGNPSFGAGYACVNNRCTGCSAATGNKYLVDPINGNDAKATGSGVIGAVANAACSFKTVTRALEVAGGFAVPGTQIIVVGATGQTVALAASETLPLLVPANVTITTRAGPISLFLPASGDASLSNIAGFQLAGDQAAITPDPAAPLTIDGASNTSGIAIGVAPGAGKAAALSYVTVENTGGNGIAVSNGVLSIGQGVTVTNAGTSAKRRDGLNIGGGAVRIAVAAGQAPTSFLNNTQHGIYVTGAGVLSVTGVPVTLPAPNGQGTVVVSGNFSAGVRIFEAPGAAAQSTLDGLVAWANPSSGLRVYGGSKVKVRNGVFLANGGNGVYVTSYDGTAAGNDLSQLDFGTAADPGRNTLQALLGSNPDVTGVCVSMAPNRGALTLHAAGNVFAGPVDCSTSMAPLLRAPTCSGFVDVGVVISAGTAVTVDASGCL